MSELRKAIVDARRLTSLLAPVLRVENLTLEEWLILDVLAENDGLSMNEIGAATRASNATLSRHVDALVNRALLFREVAFEDRRRILIFLSERGLNLHRSLLTSLTAESANR
ncbi:MarR family transcriptional regulator [Paeniglutamicibacter sp. ZC-3]|uniref:MarR family winged helix-turn-helix transcriptional regulator n=1 Tax=Paeniglutamicibacter sp. ZC-3 TaxID=2986919 RepID=UPI0021F76147|nr:MarR family transcriptional regulator [Paeniglutamicibacter sp. ZC-3]MCV9996196.1 MarR family transcriptional regulator [Paeniglutamicibacter sp. ZC-3]